MATPFRATAVIGGAGFIGSHLTTHLLTLPGVERVVVYDNFTSGRRWHLDAVAQDPRLAIVEGDVEDVEALTAAVAGVSCIVHLASNPDIARAVTDPTIDFHQGTALTQAVAEAARRVGAERVLYASGSGVYGELGDLEVGEDHGPLVPISTYGASKLAGEALLASYAYMFGMQCRAFRFGNVVGPHQTHGVGFDFVRKLLDDPHRLEILGDGTQSKSYVHVEDVVAALVLAGAAGTEAFQVFNVATLDYVTVTEIALLAARCVGIDPDGLELAYEGGDRGWKGDVPIVRLDSSRIRALGWSNRSTATEALERSMRSMLEDAKAGRLW